MDVRDEIDRMLQPGAIVPVDMKTTAMLVQEIQRLRAVLERVRSEVQR
jgi:hypothetical protein